MKTTLLRITSLSRQFYGMMNQMGKFFAPSLAQAMQPLRELLSKNSKNRAILKTKPTQRLKLNVTNQQCLLFTPRCSYQTFCRCMHHHMGWELCCYREVMGNGIQWPMPPDPRQRRKNGMLRSTGICLSM